MRANRVSLTAVKIGRLAVYLGHNPETAPLLPPGAAQSIEAILTHAGYMRPWYFKVWNHPCFTRMIRWMEALSSPGFVLHIGMRKRFLDDEVRRAIEEGASQVLVVGAGFDTLCVRLSAEFPHVRFVEVDHPATHKVKRRALEDLGQMRVNLHLVGVDLATTALATALSEVSGWKEGETSAVVAEGVLMYLDRESVNGFLQAVHDLTGVQSTLLFTYMQVENDSLKGFGSLSALLRGSLTMLGEPLRWGVASEQELSAFLASHGFDAVLDPARLDLGSRYLEAAGLGHRAYRAAEFVAIALRGTGDRNRS